jgi:hypothetical protein
VGTRVSPSVAIGTLCGYEARPREADSAPSTRTWKKQQCSGGTSTVLGSPIAPTNCTERVAASTSVGRGSVGDAANSHTLLIWSNGSVRAAACSCETRSRDCIALTRDRNS